MNNKTAILATAYLAPIQYYTKLIKHECVYIEKYENYSKQTYRNRCTIAGPNGPLTLSIPVIHNKKSKTPIKDIMISDHGNWQHLHWNAIQSAYNNTPFFEYYKDDIITFYSKNKQPKYLWDFNEELRELMCQLLDIDKNVRMTSEFIKEVEPNVKDYRESIHPKIDYNTNDDSFIVKPYYQVFEDKLNFIPNLSIIDLLFNMGPESIIILNQSFK